MFLAAAPYFQSRFESSSWILAHFQSAEISISSVTNVGVMLILTGLQKNASYPKRVSTALIFYTICFTVLALSTLVQTSASVYFGFLLIVVAATSASTGLIQNGLFSFVSGFGRSEYTQAIMTGQAIAGILPPLTQIITVLAVPPQKPGEAESESQSSKSAFIYFLTATAVSGFAFLAFVYLVRRQGLSKAKGTLKSTAETTLNGTSEEDVLTDDATTSRSDHDRSVGTERSSVPMTTLFRKLPFLASAVFICFAVTMVFPVFTTSITSVSNIDSAVFIPLGFLVWNIGDLLGRLITLSPKVALTHYPYALFCLAMARLLFIPLYFLCNIGGHGAVVNSDAFYLFVVQGLFGISNGYLGSECMMGAGDWVAPEEREAAGGFMGLMLVGGLTVGSLLSFLLGGM
jgi:solute carrier family 29 (equilibrative nucleoside transporter), member 1/2/3